MGLFSAQALVPPPLANLANPQFSMAEEGKVFLDANGLYLDSFKLARAIWDDGFRPTVRTHNAFLFSTWIQPQNFSKRC